MLYSYSHVTRLSTILIPSSKHADEDGWTQLAGRSHPQLHQSTWLFNDAQLIQVLDVSGDARIVLSPILSLSVPVETSTI